MHVIRKHLLYNEAGHWEIHKLTCGFFKAQPHYIYAIKNEFLGQYLHPWCLIRAFNVRLCATHIFKHTANFVVSDQLVVDAPVGP